MNPRSIAAGASLLALSLISCAGGGGGAAVAPVRAPLVGSQNAIIPVSFAIPRRSGSATAHATSSSTRAPAYVSPGIMSISLYDGTMLIYIGNIVIGSTVTLSTVYAASGPSTATGGTCQVSGTYQCTATITTTIGTHTFDVVTYATPQTAPAPSSASAPSAVPADATPPPNWSSGGILSEGELGVTLFAGNNPPRTITLLGVAQAITFGSISPPLSPTGYPYTPPVGIVGTTYAYGYAVTDAASFEITLPGNYDNGPVTIAETDGGGIVTMAPVSLTTPPMSTGTQYFTLTCAKPGTATIQAMAASHPNANYASGLTYSPANYSKGTLGSSTFVCAPNSATLPLVIQ